MNSEYVSGSFDLSCITSNWTQLPILLSRQVGRTIHLI